MNDHKLVADDRMSIEDSKPHWRITSNDRKSLAYLTRCLRRTTSMMPITLRRQMHRASSNVYSEEDEQRHSYRFRCRNVYIFRKHLIWVCRIIQNYDLYRINFSDWVLICKGVTVKRIITRWVKVICNKRASMSTEWFCRHRCSFILMLQRPLYSSRCAPRWLT